MTTDGTDFIRQQHQEIRSLFASLEGATGEDRREPYECLVRLLAVHETAEELVVYPVLESTGDEGKRIADERRAEEDSGKKALSDLEKVPLESAEFATQLATVKALVLPHAEQEEATVLPLLEQTQDQAALDRMTTALKAAEAIAPTHPHPHGPESALGNLAIGPFVGMVDRARDLLRDALR